MIEIKVNGQIIDLFGNDTIAMTYAANNFNDISSRNGEFSNSFTIPVTANNINIFGHPNQINTASTFNKNFNSCQVYEDGILVVDGFCKLLSTQDDIEIKIFSGNSSWIDLIGEKNLSDIDLSDFDHILSDEVVNDNRLNTTGFVYANCHYGNTVDFYPSIYFSTLIYRIFSGIGFSVAGTLLNDDLFNAAVIPYCQKNWLKHFGTTWYHGLFLPYNGISLTNGKAIACIGTRIDLKPKPESVVFDILSEWVDEDAPTGEETVMDMVTPFVGKISGNIKFRLNTSFGSGTATAKIHNNLGTYITLGSVTYTGTGVYDIELNKDAFNFSNGVSIYYTVVIHFSTAVTSFDCIGGEYIVDNGIDEYWPQERNQKTHLSQSLPTAKQKDFLKLVFNMFGVQITTDYATNTIYLNRFIDVSDTTTSVDVSKIIDHSIKPKIEFGFGDYGQTNYLKYAYDEADPLLYDGFGDGVIEIDNKLLPKEKTLYESKFAPIARKLIDSSEWASYPLFTANKILPRVAYVVQNSSNLFVILGQPALATNSHLYFDNINWPNIVINYYPPIVSIITLQKKLTLNLRLTKINVMSINGSDNYSYNLRYNRPVYINETVDGSHINGYFYLNIVSQYKFGVNQSTEVEFLPLLI